MFRKLQNQIKQHGDHTEDDDGSDDHGHLEGLAAVNDQITQSPPCGKEFSDDNADQGKTDIDFHRA